MAKQLVNPIERHIDKGVLAIAGLVLIGVIAKFIVTSPHPIELGGQNVAPRDVDRVILANATDVRDRLARSSKPEVNVEAERDTFLASLNPFSEGELKTKYPLVANLHPEVPLVGPPEPIEGDIRLVDVVQPTKPVVIHGRSSLLLNIPEEATFDMLPVLATPTNWATISALFKHVEQRERQRKTYLPDFEDPALLGMEVQRRAMRSDGTWSEEDWRTVDTWAPTQFIPEYPDIQLIQESDGELATSSAVQSKVTQFWDEVRDDKNQLDLLRPLPVEALNGDTWQLPIITSRRDVLLQDDQLQFPDDPPQLNPMDRYPDAPLSSEQSADDGLDDTLSWPEQCEQMLAKAAELLKQAKADENPDLAVQANNLGVDIVTNSATSSRLKEQARQLIRVAAQTERDIKRKIAEKIARGGGDSSEEIKPVRQLLPNQQVWSYDGYSESIPGGHSYQYRVRFLLFNRFLGLPKKLADPYDALKPDIFGPWSEPSDPIAIPPSRRFFVTNVQERESGDEVFTEMFRWFEGVWVRNSQARFSVGDKLAATARAKVPLYGAEGPGEYNNPSVDFEENVMLIDINKDTKLRREVPVGRGVKFGLPTESPIVVFMDDQGRVFERLLDMDKGHPERAKFRGKVWKPEKLEVTSGPEPPAAPKSGRGAERGSRGSRERGTRGGSMGPKRQSGKPRP